MLAGRASRVKINRVHVPNSQRANQVGPSLEAKNAGNKFLGTLEAKWKGLATISSWLTTQRVKLKSPVQGESVFFRLVNTEKGKYLHVGPLALMRVDGCSLT
ncbi:hypothetical protein D3C86_1745810 [compost metagenome]